jgi:hypothetical protein
MYCGSVGVHKRVRVHLTLFPSIRSFCSAVLPNTPWSSPLTPALDEGSLYTHILTYALVYVCVFIYKLLWIYISYMYCSKSVVQFHDLRLWPLYLETNLERMRTAFGGTNWLLNDTTKDFLLSRRSRILTSAWWISVRVSDVVTFSKNNKIKNK